MLHGLREMTDGELGRILNASPEEVSTNTSIAKNSLPF